MGSPASGGAVSIRLRSAQAALEVHIENASVAAQARVSLLNFRTYAGGRPERRAGPRGGTAQPVGPAADGRPAIVPISPPTTQREPFAWPTLLELAEERRPDLVELKLILEADQQLLLQVRNAAYPQLDAVGRYRWNGIEGELPDGTYLRSQPGEFTDWTLGVNFSVPLGLRQRPSLAPQPRAGDRPRPGEPPAGLARRHARSGPEPSQHRAGVDPVRFGQADAGCRPAEPEPPDRELSGGRSQFINALLAINDWGNAISAEAQYLSLYNAELANLERQTGTILETHGVRFYEERFCTLGPLGELGRGRQFPSSLPPSENAPRYPEGQRPAEESFNLENPVERLNRNRPRPEEVPPPVREALPLPQ